MYDPDHPEISGSVTPPSDEALPTEGDTLVDYFRRLSERLRARFLAEAKGIV